MLLSEKIILTALRTLEELEEADKGSVHKLLIISQNHRAMEEAEKKLFDRLVSKYEKPLRGTGKYMAGGYELDKRAKQKEMP